MSICSLRNDPVYAFKKLLTFALQGMALLSMCLNLIQEQIVAKFRWMAKELGINRKEDIVEAKAKVEPYFDSWWATFW